MALYLVDNSKFNWEVLRTDIGTSKTTVSFVLRGTTEQGVINNIDRLNKMSTHDGTDNHYTYRREADAPVPSS